MSVKTHYNTLLAGQYLWMAGGFSAAAGQNRRFFRKQGIVVRKNGCALDLGAGCGFQSIPLAEAGFTVLAVDFSSGMLDILRKQAGTLPVKTIQADILEPSLWDTVSPELVTCMGDTLTHMADCAAAEKLLRLCAGRLLPGGRLILSFRDYCHEPEGSRIIIPVRRDGHRIFLCRLEYENERVRVTDILYARDQGRWDRVAGTYTKIRLAPARIIRFLANEGFAVTRPDTGDGMVTIIAEKPLTG